MNKNALKQTLTSVGLLPLARRLQAAKHAAWVAYLEKRVRAPWERGEETMRRQYRDYDHYLEHQKSKLDTLGVGAVDSGLNAPLREVLVARLARYAFPRGTTALCLAARRGGEVQAFLDHHCFAVGIDLNPGPENRYVVVGDFHALQFPNASTDVVFTNSLDHALELEKVFAEVARVLKPGGRFLIETAYGFEETDQPSHWEATFWATTDVLVQRVTSSGLELVDRVEIMKPHKGVHLQFQLPGG